EAGDVFGVDVDAVLAAGIMAIRASQAFDEVGLDENRGVDAVDDGDAPPGCVRAAERTNHARHRSIRVVALGRRWPRPTPPPPSMNFALPGGSASSRIR